MRSLWDREFSHIFFNEWHSPAGPVPCLIFYTALEILVLYALFAMDICITEYIFRDSTENKILLTHWGYDIISYAIIFHFRKILCNIADQI